MPENEVQGMGSVINTFSVWHSPQLNSRRLLLKGSKRFYRMASSTVFFSNAYEEGTVERLNWYSHESISPDEKNVDSNNAATQAIHLHIRHQAMMTINSCHEMTRRLPWQSPRGYHSCDRRFHVSRCKLRILRASSIQAWQHRRHGLLGEAFLSEGFP